MSKLADFIVQYHNLAQQLYDVLTIKIWFFRNVFSENELDIRFVSENNLPEVSFHSGYTKGDKERDESMKALNDFFNGKGIIATSSPPSLYIGITKIYSSENDCKSEWKLKELLGRGIQGIIFSACCESECTHVMKIEDVSIESRRKDFVHEAELNELFGINDIGPIIVSIYIGKYVGIMIMEKLTITLYNLEQYILEVEDKEVAIRIVNIIKGKFLTILSKLHKLGYVHMDLHEQNIMLKIDMNNLIDNLSKGRYELRFIDFGIMGNFGNESHIYDEMRFDIWYRKMKKLLYVTQSNAHST